MTQLAKQNTSVSESSPKIATTPAVGDQEALPGTATVWFCMTESEQCSPRKGFLAWAFKDEWEFCS